MESQTGTIGTLGTISQTSPFSQISPINEKYRYNCINKGFLHNCTFCTHCTPYFCKLLYSWKCQMVRLGCCYLPSFLLSGISGFKEVKGGGN